MNRRSRLSNTAAGLIALVVIGIGVFLAQTKQVPFRHHYEIDVAFRSVNGVRAGSQVRIAGVTVGKVVGTRAEPGTDDAALVRLRFEGAGLPLHRDAQFKIRPRLFLEGNFFVDVRPGSPTAPRLRDGAVVPVSQSATPVQFDQLLSALDYDTRDDLKVVLREYGRALKVGAPAVNRTYAYTERAYRDSSIVADAQLGSRPGELHRLVRDSGRVSAALDRDPRALQDLIVGFYRTARGFASEGDHLDAALRELPRTLRVGYPTLGALNRAFPPLRRFARALQPAFRSSVPALNATLPLTRQLRGLVRPAELQGLARALRRAAPALVRANRTGVPYGEQTRLAASCLNHILIPWSQDKVPDQQFPAKVQIYKELSRVFPGLSGESRAFDANGSWFRTLLVTGNASYQVGQGKILTTAFPIAGINPPAPATNPPFRPDVPCETQDRPDLRSTPDAAPARIATDADSPAAQTRLAQAQAVAVDWLRGQVKREGLDKTLTVSDQPFAAADMKRAGR